MRTHAASLVKLAIGTALAVLVACEPVDGGGSSGASTSSGSPSSSGAGGTNAYVVMDADALCNRLITECRYGALQQDCIATFHPLRVTSACKNAIPTASCADLQSTTSGLSNTCFPSCARGTAPVCNGDGTITVCTETGTTHRKDCEDFCQSLGYLGWVGSCGTTYAGETAAQPQCWCR